MIDFSDLGQYLPNYLSKEAQENLFSELSQFPANIDERIFTSYLKNDLTIFQGDGINNLTSINLPDSRIGQVPGIILSNTCDLDSANERLVPPRMIYATIVNFEKYKNMLVRDFVNTGRRSLQKVESHLENIKKQRVSHMFFLPKGGGIESESIAFLDRINNLPPDTVDSSELLEQRLFTLSDYGFYLFLFKLSIHFTRVRENVFRTPTQPQKFDT